ncbi:MAG: permease, partial [Salinibacterium sp.]|nr:permease [Salinibacterium sp.]
FLLASTNLVIELGILIFVFLAWQFVVGEYVGGLMLIAVMWAVVRLTLPKKLVEAARDHAESARSSHDDDASPQAWRQLIRSREGWERVSGQYWMEWSMVWKDVVFGFSVAGIIAAFVPPQFFQSLFVGSGPGSEPDWWQVILHTLIGPVAAFFTFIGSMGNIPLAAILFGSGVSFAGVMAFIFSDLVVFPVLRISARYFGWKMAAYILGVFLFSLVITSVALHFAFEACGMLPDPSAANATQTEPASRFKIDYTFFLNAAFLGLSLAFAWLSRRKRSDHDAHEHLGHDSGGSDWMQRLLRVLAVASVAWLAAGAVLWFIL